MHTVHSINKVGSLNYIQVGRSKLLQIFYVEQQTSDLREVYVSLREKSSAPNLYILQWFR